MYSVPLFSTPSEDAEFKSSPKLRAALQWWQDCWLKDAAQQAEKLRDGTLQELLALRRNVELSLLTGLSPSSSEMAVWLAKLELLYQNLDRLGDRLNPPYLEDDLDLALQHLIGPWIDRHPEITLSVQYPQCLSIPGFNRILLFAIEQLLLLFLQLQDMMILRVRLIQENNLSILRLCLDLTQEKSENLNSVLQKIEYLQLVFPVLVDGCFGYSSFDNRLSCEFSWNSVCL
jgi:hypothetical protein